LPLASLCIAIQNPGRVAPLRHVLQKFRLGTSCLCARLQCHPAKPRQLRLAQIVQKFLRFVGGDLERFRNHSNRLRLINE